MRGRFLGWASWPLIWLTLKAYGHWWIDENVCRTLLTAIMRATIWLARI